MAQMYSPTIHLNMLSKGKVISTSRYSVWLCRKWIYRSHLPSLKS